MIKIRKFMGISMARRVRRRWLVVGLWALGLALVIYFPALLRFRFPFFGPTGEWAFFFGFLLVNVLGGQSRRGFVSDFEGRTPEDGPGDYSFMTPEDIAARKEAERQNRLDEREVRVRNAAHYRAYVPLRWFAFLLVLAAVTDHRMELADMRESLLLLLYLVILWLPQSILLWTEPDMEAEG
jgi:hypothetical protein